MVYEKIPKKERETEAGQVIRSTGPSLFFLFITCSLAGGALSEGGRREVFSLASLVFGLLAATALTMYGFERLKDFRKKK